MLDRIDMQRYQQSVATVRSEADACVEQCKPFGIAVHDNLVLREQGGYARDNSIQGETVRFDLKMGRSCDVAAKLFQAYELLGEPGYLQVGLKTADFYLKVQQPAGYFPAAAELHRDGTVETWKGPGHFDPDLVRIQDSYQYSPFSLLLYAHKLTGQQKYFAGAKKCVDLLVKLQDPQTGSCPDYHDFRHKDRSKLVTTWAGVAVGGSFNDYATTDPMRMSIVMYHVTGEKEYLRRTAKIGQWMFDTQLGQGKVRGWCQQYGPDNEPAWVRSFEGPVIETRTFKLYTGPMLAWFYAATGDERYRKLFEESFEYMRAIEEPVRSKDIGGWPRELLPDGTFVFSYDYKIYRMDRPETWLTPENMTKEQLRVWNDPKQGEQHMAAFSGVYPGYPIRYCQKIMQLLKAGGRDAFREWHGGPTKYTPQQYLEARIAAVRKVIGYQIRQKGLTWQEHGYNVRLALGQIDADQAATGGRGLQTDYYKANARVDWTTTVVEVEDWLNVPLAEFEN